MRFAGATLLIQQYEPMWANFTSAFVVRNGQVVMEEMALDVDGAQVEGTGTIDAAKWPESTFQITAHHQLPRARAIFYAKEAFTLHGEGDFTGTVHKYSGGYEVKGEFVSPEVGYDDYRFQHFKASVVWVPTRFDVLAAEADLYGGRAAFTYQLDPARRPATPARRHLGRVVSRRRPDHLHRIPRDPRPAPGRPGHWPHHARLDTRPPRPRPPATARSRR